MATPHVPVQLLLAPGERRTIDLDLPPGRYRLRTLHPGTATDVEHDGGAFPGLRVTASGAPSRQICRRAATACARCIPARRPISSMPAALFPACA